MPRATVKKALQRAWDVPVGHFCEPVLRWWPDWRSSLGDRERKDARSLRISSATIFNRERGLLAGEWWAVGNLGKLGANQQKIDVATSRQQTIVGMKHELSKKTRPKKASKA